MLIELNSAKSLDLSFDFKILSHKDRVMKIEIKGLLREIKYSDRVFVWFMEDLIAFLDKNKYQRRWDYGKIIVLGIEKMGFTKDNNKNFKSKFKLITSWDMEWI